MVERVKERQVDDVATMKALADPVRLAILGALMGGESRELTVKEIAAALEEPQTKLYRHVKQLESAGLIVVAGTRLVSGIVESRYAAAQDSLRLSRELFAQDSATRSSALEAVFAAMDRVRADFRSQLLKGRVDFSAPGDGSAGPPVVFADFALRLSPHRLVRLREQLGALLEEVAAEGAHAGEEAVDVTLLSLLYAVPQTPAGD
ncbi:ArsR/SmtB family transcription factor [Kitasatospora sp. NPDC050543]|uniref:ArsR/SmtB family transcription factor n=1 Tax=Kitasatospora sp. NPDC050543 TaxID=3364054 RepID=UPI0037AE5BE5